MGSGHFHANCHSFGGESNVSNARAANENLIGGDKSVTRGATHSCD
jgi:hypothetical protein